MRQEAGLTASMGPCPVVPARESSSELQLPGLRLGAGLVADSELAGEGGLCGVQWYACQFGIFKGGPLLGGGQAT